MAIKSVPPYEAGVVWLVIILTGLVWQLAGCAMTPPAAGFPHNPAALQYYNLGGANVEVGRFPEAIDAYQRAIKLEPSAASPYVNLGAAYFLNRSFAPAAAALKQAAVLNPNHFRTYYYLGHVLYTQRKFDEAVTAYAKALELGMTNDPAIMYVLALKRSGQVDKADSLLKQWTSLLGGMVVFPTGGAFIPANSLATAPYRTYAKYLLGEATETEVLQASSTEFDQGFSQLVMGTQSLLMNNPGVARQHFQLAAEGSLQGVNTEIGFYVNWYRITAQEELEKLAQPSAGSNR